MTIRRAKPEDIPAIVELEKQAPELAHWSEQAYRAAFDPGVPERVLLVSENEGALRAFLIAGFSSGECELENIVVARDSRRCGTASQMLQLLIADARTRAAKSILLEVRESNAAARALYKKFGFEENGRRRKYYNNPVEDAVLYSLIF